MRWRGGRRQDQEDRREERRKGKGMEEEGRGSGNIILCGKLLFVACFMVCNREGELEEGDGMLA